jgi:hypothetical protein
MNSGDFLGFVEGWTFSARYNQVSISMILSPIAFSLQAMRWNDVPVIEHGTQSIQLWIGSMPQLWRKEKTSGEPDNELWFCTTHTDRFGHRFAG